LAVVLVYVLVIALFAALIWFFVPPMLTEASILLASLPQYLSQVEDFNLSFLESAGGPSLSDTISSLQSAFIDTGAGVLQFISSFFGGAFYFILTIVVSIYFSLQETGIDDFLRLISPEKHRGYVLSLWKRSQRKIGLWMQGQLLLSLIITILLYLGLSLLGVPYALVLAIFAGVMELIPVFGSLVAAVPGVGVALVTGEVTLALWVAGLYLIVSQFQAHLIYPLVVKKIVGVAPILVIIALIAGGQLAGFLGVLLSVPIAAVIQEFVNDVQKGRSQKLEG
jgi:predicted PurR-regulated permease PerM